MRKRNSVILASGGLLAIVFVLYLSGLFSPRPEDAEVEAAIIALGGKVDRDDDAPGRPIVAVYLGFSKAKDAEAGLKRLVGLKSLYSLTLTETQLTDAECKELAGLTSLKWL